MVGEFPELQGVMGGLYAKEQGEPEPVWKAVYGHYEPTGLGDDDGFPLNREGAVISLADKLDTLASMFSVGIVPTGSRDPFGLRRAAALRGEGIIQRIAVVNDVADVQYEVDVLPLSVLDDPVDHPHELAVGVLVSRLDKILRVSEHDDAAVRRLCHGWTTSERDHDRDDDAENALQGTHRRAV